MVRTTSHTRVGGRAEVSVRGRAETYVCAFVNISMYIPGPVEPRSIRAALLNVGVFACIHTYTYIYLRAAHEPRRALKCVCACLHI